MNNVAVIEALLFGRRGLMVYTLEELAKLTNNTLDVMAVRIEELATSYEADETSGLKIIETDEYVPDRYKREFRQII